MAPAKQEWLQTNVQLRGDGVQVIALNNVHKEVGKFQEGSTAMMIHGNLIQQFDPEGSGCNDLGLGHWTFMRFV